MSKFQSMSIMSSSRSNVITESKQEKLADYLRRATKSALEEKKQKKFVFEKRKKRRLHELMSSLTETYFQSIISACMHRASKGDYECYLNFDRKYFKANFPTLGNPSHVRMQWLEEISNPNSLVIQEVKKKRPELFRGDWDSLHGITFDPWNNKAFTVKFSWR